jgi:hypothetical protein
MPPEATGKTSKKRIYSMFFPFLLPIFRKCKLWWAEYKREILPS